MLTMTPSNICMGFKKCGVYPFNDNAIDCGIAFTAGSNEDEDSNSSPKRSRDEDSSIPDTDDLIEKCNEFSAEKLEVFQTRYEEGYDIYDRDYMMWLEINHPSTVEDYCLKSIPSTSSIADNFTSIEPLATVEQGEFEVAIN